MRAPGARERRTCNSTTKCPTSRVSNGNIHIQTIFKCTNKDIPMHTIAIIPKPQILQVTLLRLNARAMTCVCVCVCVVGFGVWTVPDSVRFVCYSPARRRWCVGASSRAPGGCPAPRFQLYVHCVAPCRAHDGCRASVSLEGIGVEGLPFVASYKETQ